MAKVIFGNHSAVMVPRQDRDSIRKFYCDVLGGQITKADPERDFLRLGEDFYIAFIYGDVADESEPFSTKVVSVGVRDSTYVLDGLLYHESDLRIEEHYTDTASFTDHVFALMHLLGFRFAPRIRDLGDTKLYIPKGEAAYNALNPMIEFALLKFVRCASHTQIFAK